MSGYYPAGLNDYTPGCPWSEPGVPERDFDVTCTQCLSKTVTVTTNNYIPGAEGCDYEPDGEGGYVAMGWHDPDDTSDTNWADEYHENDHYTPIQLIELFRTHLKNELSANEFPENKVNLYKHLIEECGSWIEDETEYMEG